VTLVFGAAAANGQPAPNVAAAVYQYANAHEFSGTVLVQRDGRTVLRQSFGLANRAFAVPTRPDVRYRIASITKLFTAVMILQLRDEGLLDLTAPVSRYLPGYARNGADKVPVQNLLNHTSGLPNVDTVHSYDEAVANGLPVYQTPLTTQQLLAKYASGPLVRESGKVFDYNNADYIVLGKIIEALTGSTFEEALDRRILRPLALQNSGALSQHKILAGLADTYFRPPGKTEYVNDLPVYIENWYAAGSMYATVDDLAAFAQALFAGRFLKPDSLKRMLTSGLDGYGYGLWIRKLKVGAKTYRTAERYGSIMGANGLVFRILDKDITIVILANTNAADMGEFAVAAAEAVLAAESR
jgi:CubicO group peptidase (beta-lactamase class C family)